MTVTRTHPIMSCASHIRTMAFAATCFGVALSFGNNPVAAKDPRLTQLHYQYFAAIHAGDIAKARDIAQLGNIDPNNVGGHPLVSTLFNHGGKLPASVAYLTDQAFDYVFKELKQPFNAKLQPSGDQTVFAGMCLAFSRGNAFQAVNINDVYNTVNRIKFAFTQGADPQPLQGIPDRARKRQPFPACVTEYLKYRHIPQAAGAIRSILNDYLERGANPDYAQPISLAAETLDAELFALLASHHAKFGRVFQVNSYMPAACMRGGGLTSITKDNTTDLDTLLGRLPNPKDADTAVARDFLIAYIEAGGDVSEKQHRFRNDGTRCHHSMESLFEKAIGAGQVTYAKMVQELERLPRTRPPSPTAASIAPPPSAAQRPSGSRVTTASINVRQQPSLNGTLMSTLGPNIVFEIEDTSPDGQWSRINAPTVVRGWAYNSVILKSSVPNGANP